MVAENNTLYITPMPVSAARAATAEESSDWVGEWLLDLATHYPAFARNAEQHADGLNLIGYTTKSSLTYMHENTAVREIQDALELNLIMAKQLVLEGRALHPRHELADNKPPRVDNTSRPAVTSKALKPFPPWPERLTGTHICCPHLLLLRWLAILLCFVEAHSGLLGPLLQY